VSGAAGTAGARRAVAGVAVVADELDRGRERAGGSAAGASARGVQPRSWASRPAELSHTGCVVPSAGIRYNHSEAYVNDVLARAQTYTRQSPPLVTAGMADEGDACTSGGIDLPAGPADLHEARRLSSPRAFWTLPDWAMAAGRAPEPVDARLYDDVVWILRRYHLRVSAAREPGHHTHGDGTAVDYRAHADGRKALVFVPTVALAHTMARVFRDAGTPAEALDGTTPLGQRRAIVARLRTGDTRVVVNVGVLSEGFDEPSVDCVVMATPTRSQVKYAQCVGRALGTFPGKRDCLIIDIVGVSDRLDLQTLTVSRCQVRGAPKDARYPPGLSTRSASRAHRCVHTWYEANCSGDRGHAHTRAARGPQGPARRRRPRRIREIRRPPVRRRPAT
jgi:hypothetical protein